MLHIHLQQNWFALSDPAMEEALYEITSLRQFSKLSLTRGSIPEDTTIVNFRHLLEQHGLAAGIKGHFDISQLVIGFDQVLYEKYCRRHRSVQASVTIAAKLLASLS